MKLLPTDLDLVDSHGDQLKMFLYCLIFWSAAFWLVCDKIRIKSLAKKKGDDVKNRIISILHGIAVLVFTLIHIKNDDPQFGAKNTNFQHFIILSSCAYFIYDMLACLYYGLVDLGLVLHHGMVMVGYSSALF